MRFNVDLSFTILLRNTYLKPFPAPALSIPSSLLFTYTSCIALAVATGSCANFFRVLFLIAGIDECIIIYWHFYKKITTAGKNPVTTRARRDRNSFINYEKKYQHKSYQPLTCHGLAIYITKQPKNNNKDNNTTKAASSPFPSGIASDQ